MFKPNLGLNVLVKGNSNLHINRALKSMRLTSEIDFIEITSTGEKLYIKKIIIIDSTIWKGSFDGVLHYKDGRTDEVEMSNYGDFFGFKEEDRSMFSKGVLYKYELHE